MTGRFLTRPYGRSPHGPRPWYRRRPYQLAVVAVVLLAAVLTDRYDRYDPVQQQRRLAGLAATVRSDLQFCRDGVTLVSRRWDALGPDATTAARRRVGALAGRAEPTCTPVGQDGGVYGLASLQAPRGLPASGKVTRALYDLTEWAYPSAARYLLAVRTLAAHPGDTATRLELTAARRSMGHYRREASTLLAAVARAVAMSPPSLGLPAV